VRLACKQLKNEEVEGWIELAGKFAQAGEWDVAELDPSRKIGYLKHGFVAAFFCLQMVPTWSYHKCIEKTMMLAGDTDTNGAIVGGMIGAYYGRSHLPEYMV
jgi:ADP-ribosylglycohydrolase